MEALCRPGIGLRFLRIEPREVAEVPLPQPREKSGRANPKHRQTRKLPDVPWLARAKRKPDLSARRKQDRTIPREIRGENHHPAAHRVPPLRSPGGRRLPGSDILQVLVR